MKIEVYMEVEFYFGFFEYASMSLNDRDISPLGIDVKLHLIACSEDFESMWQRINVLTTAVEPVEYMTSIYIFVVFITIPTVPHMRL